VPEPSVCEVDMAIKKKNHKSPDTDEIITQLFIARGRTIRSEAHKLNNFIWNK